MMGDGSLGMGDGRLGMGVGDGDRVWGSGDGGWELRDKWELVVGWGMGVGGSGMLDGGCGITFSLPLNSPLVC